jgi:hypothetical protein
MRACCRKTLIEAGPQNATIQSARGGATPTYYLPARFITMTEVNKARPLFGLTILQNFSPIMCRWKHTHMDACHL